MSFDLLFNFDVFLFRTINLKIANHFFDFVMSLITKSGNLGAIWFLLTGFYVALGNRKTKRTGILALLAFILAHLCSNIILKNIICRQRPFVVLEGVRLLVDPPSSFSFPSGHASLAAAWSAVNFTLNGPYKNRFVILALLMGLSRVYVGVHFPLDVLFGFVVGIICCLAVIKFVKNKNLCFLP